MYGGTELKIPEAGRFGQHMNDCIRELSSGLLVAQQGCGADEFLEIRRAIGGLIGGVDTLLHDKGTLHKI